MTKIIKIIGSIVCATILYSIPILQACSFFFAWDSFVQYVLSVFSVCEFACVFVVLYAAVIREDEEVDP